MIAFINLVDRISPLSDVEKMSTRTPVSARKTFNDVCRDRVSSSAKLASEFEALKGRKLFRGKAMEIDEQSVGALPGDQRVMAEFHHPAPPHPADPALPAFPALPVPPIPPIIRQGGPFVGNLA